MEPVESAEEDLGTPVCLRCLTPFDPLQHYCTNCGEAVGQLTPYIPFVNIGFSVSIYERLWRRIWFERRDRWWAKAFYFVFIAMFAEILLLVVPFVLWRRYRSGATAPGI